MQEYSNGQCIVIITLSFTLPLKKSILRHINPKLREVVGNHCLLGSLFSERFILGPGCLAMDGVTTICPMEKPKDLQRWSVLFQYPF